MAQGSGLTAARSSALIFGVALLLRLIHLWQIRNTAFFDVLMGDARSYDEWAQRIAAGDWFGRDVFYQAPLYPYFLGTIYAIVGRNLWVVRICHAVLGSASCVLLALTARRLFSPRAGLIAGLALAVYAPAIFFDSLLQKSVLDEFFICLMLWLTARLIDDRSRVRDWLFLGLAAAALSLTRENALVFVVVIAAWALAGRLVSVPAAGSPPPRSSVESSAPSSARSSVRSLSSSIFDLPAVGAFVLGLALLLVPVAIRNSMVEGGGFYVTTSQFGPNFFMGNNALADGTAMSLRAGRGSPEYERQDAIDIAERAMGRTLTPGEVSSYWTERSLAFVKAQPIAWTKLQLRKAVLLLNRTEILDTESQESYAEYSWPLRIGGLFGHFGILVPLALFGIILTSPDWRRLWPLLAMIVVYSASVVMFYIYARYRYPLVPMLLVFAAVGLERLPAFVRAATSRQKTFAFAAVVVAAVFCNWSMVSADMNRTVTEHNIGAALQSAGRLDEAVAHYRRAIEISPDYAPAYSNIGTVLQSQGKIDEAIRAYQDALKYRPDFPEVEYNLGNALLKANRPEEAADHFRRASSSLAGSADVHNNLGNALANQGKMPEALVEFQKAVQLDPKSSTAHRNLGNAYSALGRSDEALEELQQAAALDPKDPAPLYDLGSLLLELRIIPQALQALQAAAALTPDSPDAADLHNNLGIALGSTGRFDLAVAEFEKALQLRPDFEDARKNLEMTKKAIQKVAK